MMELMMTLSFIMGFLVGGLLSFRAAVRVFREEMEDEQSNSCGWKEKV